MKKKKHNLSKIFIWLFFVLVFFFIYQTNKELFDITFLQNFVADYKIWVVLFYILLLSVLGLFFIPSTPFAIAGVALFTHGEAYLFNLLGILTSSTIVYFFAKFLGLDHHFKERYPKQLKKTRKALKNKEMPIIVGWSFFPVVPTDLIIYVSSSLRIPLWKCLIGVLIGEGALNAMYIFTAYSIF